MHSPDATHADFGPESRPLSVPCTDCRLLLQRKAGYLAIFDGRWRLAPSTVSETLRDEGVPVEYVAGT
jgi:hypothetical protein